MVAPASTEPVRILYAAPDCGIGSWRHFALVVWSRQPTAESALALKRAYVQLADELPDGFWAFGAIEADVQQPAPPERTAIADAMNAAGPAMRGSVVVLEAKGFVATTVRLALGAMLLVTHEKFPRAFVSNLDEAALWMRARAPGAENPKELVSRYEEMRKAVRARFPR